MASKSFAFLKLSTITLMTAFVLGSLLTGEATTVTAIKNHFYFSGLNEKCMLQWIS